MSITRIINNGSQLLRHMGLRWLTYRALYAIRLHTGMLALRFPVRAWEDQPLAEFLYSPELAEPASYAAYRRKSGPVFFFRPEDLLYYRGILSRWATAGSPLTAADAIGKGILSYFEKTPMPIGFPPDWFINPWTGEHIFAHRHWSRISDFGQNDIKVIWEASRFGFTYPLVRAYWQSGDERYADWFWRLVADWRTHNPPQLGPHWKCGQEISFRVMAWCFGLYGFLASPATTPLNLAKLSQMIAVSGCRIEANLGYALSQRNNHGISEAMGLWTIGLLFPELKSADRWRELGREELENQARTLIYEDGAFSQHSVNYQRLMLHDYLWAIRLGDLNKQPLSAELRKKIGLSGLFLYQLQDGTSGQVPYYGQNDGSLILPLNNCSYHDFRPIIQAVRYLSTGKRCYGEGPWDEDLLWLFGPEALNSPTVSSERTDLKAECGGYYTLRAPESFIFTRCASFRHRPSQADLLHVDLWWRGQNIALDAGTFSYNAPPPWDNVLSSTLYHNTVSVDGLDQMERVTKFLWLPWIHGQMHSGKRSMGRQLAYWEGSHDGYQRLPSPVEHRRGVLSLPDDSWLVLDRLNGRSSHRYRLHWLLPDISFSWQADPPKIVLQTEAGPYHIAFAALAHTGVATLVRSDEHSARGWRAPYYGHRVSALSLDLTVEDKEVLFWTFFSPYPCEVIQNQGNMILDYDRCEVAIRLDEDHRRGLLIDLSIKGNPIDRLEVT
jgi:hypothetical protein